MSAFPNHERITRCILLARECSRDSWQRARDAKQSSAYREIRREAMDDARYWRDGKYPEVA